MKNGHNDMLEPIRAIAFVFSTSSFLANGFSTLRSPEGTIFRQGILERIIKMLRESPQRPWCRKMLTRLRLPPTVHDESHYRLWQRRFYPFNIFGKKKRQEKLNYMHNNPVKCGLVNAPGDWPWSNWRFCFLQDASILRMDRLQ